MACNCNFLIWYFVLSDARRILHTAFEIKEYEALSKCVKETRIHIYYEYFITKN